MSADGLKLPLKQRWERMHSGKNECTYYALTLTGDIGGKIDYGLQSSFVGWEASKRGWELRGPRLLTAEFAENWKSLKLPFVFVHSYEDLFVFLISGGNALIEKDVAEKKLTDLLKPVAVAPHGIAGFKVLKSVEPSALNRAPTPKVRMEVLKRDGRRCKICGRRPDDHVDLELHVHHIRPSGNHGLSEPENLITLCDTCHTGLNPHEDWSLFNHLPEFADLLDTDLNRKSLMEGVARYRKISLAAYSERSKTPASQSSPAKKARRKSI
ncbi:HNH endonuclease [Bradyrhizobium sp. LjRoot220]|uniref:HNH endonuclease n=1 Tax=Bradyrhizobium sp. LjRoot220 TaxID=3342284 RepID=UPI003ECE5595